MKWIRKIYLLGNQRSLDTTYCAVLCPPLHIRTFVDHDSECWSVITILFMWIPQMGWTITTFSKLRLLPVWSWRELWWNIIQCDFSRNSQSLHHPPTAVKYYYNNLIFCNDFRYSLNKTAPLDNLLFPFINFFFTSIMLLQQSETFYVFNNSSLMDPAPQKKHWMNKRTIICVLENEL